MISRLPGRDRGRRRQILVDFLTAARLDAIGVFGYSDEDGTEAEPADRQLVDRRDRAAPASELADLAEELITQRAEERIGEPVAVLIDATTTDGQSGRPGRAPGPRRSTAASDS